MNPRRVLVMAGGTGGHVYPALAVAQNLRNDGWLVDWVGTDRGLEANVVPAQGFELHTLPMRGLRGKGVIAQVEGFVLLIAALFAALQLVWRLKPNVALGMGGYASGPAGLACVLLRVPLVIHEQNSVAGTTNRLLAPLATRILCGLPNAFDQSAKVELVGNPVRREILQRGEQGRDFPVAFTADRPLQLLVIGGSLGSAPLNTLVPEAVHALYADGRGAQLHIRHQCGAQHLEATLAAYGKLPTDRIDVSRFIDDMADAYLWADLVVCRSGALTVSELAVTGSPSMLVPLPHAIDDHQTHNAKALSAEGAGQLLPQRELTAEKLARFISGYLDLPSRLGAMSKAARALARPNATERVADVIAEVARGR